MAEVCGHFVAVRFSAVRVRMRFGAPRKLLGLGLGGVRDAYRLISRMRRCGPAGAIPWNWKICAMRTEVHSLVKGGGWMPIGPADSRSDSASSPS